MASKKQVFGWTAYKIATWPMAAIRKMGFFCRSLAQAEKLKFLPHESLQREPSNDLQRYFDAVQSGPGIFKWRHYFEIYDRHFEKFINKEVHILEIGIYGGGSLGMWKAYFGPRCRVYGVDILEACRAYEGDGVEVFIGDQADRTFWKRFKEKVPNLDIIVDDGGHQVSQQVPTLEEMLPHLRPGGVYLCEDIHGAFNAFNFYVSGLPCKLSAFTLVEQTDKRRLVSEATAFQSAVHSIHMYPFVVVIERRSAPIVEFVAPRHGDQWPPNV
jgi:SAM-dependent methyltransferase